MTAAPEICFINHANKRESWPRDVLPQIQANARQMQKNPQLAEWLQRGGVMAAPAGSVQRLQKLHELARAGTYKTHFPIQCDKQIPLEEILYSGGDCDQWASVIMAGIGYIGHNPSLIAVGDQIDPYRHVFPAARIDKQIYFMDAKPNQAGADFNKREDSYPQIQNITESVQGSGAVGSQHPFANAVLRCWSDAQALLTPEQIKHWKALKLPQITRYNLFMGRYQTTAARKAARGWQGEIPEAPFLLWRPDWGGQNCNGTQTVQEVLDEIWDYQLTLGYQPTASAKAAKKFEALQASVFTAKSLEEANTVYATELASEVPANVLAEFVKAYKVNPLASDLDKRGAVAYVWEKLANSQRKLLPILLFEAEKGYLAGSAGNFWKKFKSGWNKLTTDPAGWLRRVFVTEPGKALQWVGKQIASARSLGGGMLGKFFLDPLGFTLLAKTLEEIGDAMVDGSISSFDTREWTETLAMSLNAAGQMLGMAAAFLPPPWNLAAAALGAVSTAVGNSITLLLNAKDYEKFRKKNNKAADLYYAQEQERYKSELAAWNAAQAQARPMQLATATQPTGNAVQAESGSGGGIIAVALGVGILAAMGR